MREHTIETAEDATRILSHLAAMERRVVKLLVTAAGGGVFLARRLPAALPPPTEGERIDVGWIWSASSYPMREPARHLRAPHHTVSDTAMVGGGPRPRWRPGEVSLAHEGVLLLDQFPDFSLRAARATLGALREGAVRASLAAVPARPRVVLATVGVCPCLRPPGSCTCRPEQIARYHARHPEWATAWTDVVELRWTRSEAQRFAASLPA